MPLVVPMYVSQYDFYHHLVDNSFTLDYNNHNHHIDSIIIHHRNANPNNDSASGIN
jgi:hypothetical protein